MCVFLGDDINQVEYQKHPQKQSAVKEQRMVRVIGEPAFYLL